MALSRMSKPETAEKRTARKHGLAEEKTFKQECILVESMHRECRDFCRALYMQVPAMMHSIDASGHIIDVSDFWLEVMGYDRREVLGRLSTEFLTDESRRYAEEIALVEFFRTGFIKDVPYRFVKKNGAVIDTLLSTTSERDNDGNLLRSIVHSAPLISVF